VLLHPWRESFRDRKHRIRLEQFLLGSLWKKSVALVLAGLALYALAGFFIIPDLLKRKLSNSVLEHSGRELSLDAVSFNPFTFDLKFSNLWLEESAGAPSVSIDQVHATLHPVSLFRRGWRLRHMVIDLPRLAFRPLIDNGEVSAPAGILPGAVTAFANSTEWNIESLNVNRGVVHINTADTVPPLQLTDLEIRVQNLRSTSGEHGDFILTAMINNSARLEGKGRLAPADAEIEADFSISGVDAARFGAYADLGPAVELASARLVANAGLSYKENRLHLGGEAEIHDIEIVDSLDHQPVFTAASLFAAGIVIDPSLQLASVKTIKVENPYLKMSRGTKKEPKLLPWLLPRINKQPIAQASQTGRFIDTIEIVGGRAEFTDLSMVPNVRVIADQIFGTLKQGGTGPETPATLKLEGNVNESGKSRLSASWYPNAPDHSVTAQLVLRDLGLPELSPYFRSFAGREITHGDLSLDLDYKISNRQLDVQDRLVINDLILGSRAEAPIGADLPLDLALALLKDNNGLLSLSIPVPRTPVDEEFDLLAVLGQASHDFVTGLVAEPFAVIGVLVGQAGRELGSVAFAGGSAAISPTQEQRMAILGSALNQRPGLGIRIHPAYDPVADRNALARQQMRLHIALATSAGPPGSASKKQLALDDSKVTAILDEFAANRLDGEQLAAIGARHSLRDTAYYQAVFDALVANENVSKLALSTLARYRAQSMVDQLMRNGVNAERIEISDAVQLTATQNVAVTLRLGLFARNVQHIISSPGYRYEDPLY
jgi:hypothetical protein